MPEQKIIVTIDSEGSLSAKTSGFKGETCLEALSELLDLEGTVASIKKTDEFHQKESVQQNRIQKLKRK